MSLAHFGEQRREDCMTKLELYSSVVEDRRAMTQDEGNDHIWAEFSQTYYFIYISYIFDGNHFKLRRPAKRSYRYRWKTA